MTFCAFYGVIIKLLLVILNQVEASISSPGVKQSE